MQPPPRNRRSGRARPLPAPPPLLRSVPSALTDTLARTEGRVACHRTELERRAAAGEATALVKALLRLAEDDLAILRNLERGLLGAPADWEGGS